MIAIVEKLKLNMKFIVLFFIFVEISRAQPDERIEETIKRLQYQLDDLNQATKEVLKDLNSEIEGNVAELKKEIQKIDVDRRLQMNLLNQSVEFAEASNESILTNNNPLFRIERIVNNSQVQLDVSNKNMEQIVINSMPKINDNVGRLNEKIQKNVRIRFARGGSQTWDVENRINSFMNKSWEDFERQKSEILAKVPKCREQENRHMKFIEDEVIQQLSHLQLNFMENDNKSKMYYDDYLKASHDAKGNKQNVDKLYEKFKKHLEETVAEVYKYSQENVKNLNEKIQNHVMNLVDEMNCTSENIQEGLENLKKIIENNVGVLNERIKMLVMDPVNGEIAWRFGISPEMRKLPNNTGITVITTNGIEKKIVCSWDAPIIDNEANCRTRPSYFREIANQVVDGILHYSEKYFSPETNTMDGFKYTLELNNPNATLHVEAVSGPFVTSKAEGIIFYPFLLISTIVTIIFNM